MEHIDGSGNAVADALTRVNSVVSIFESRWQKNLSSQPVVDIVCEARSAEPARGVRGHAPPENF